MDIQKRNAYLATWREKNRERLREQHRNWYENHKNEPALKKKKIEQSKNWRLKNIEYCREKSRSYYPAHKERMQENNKVWHEKNKTNFAYIKRAAEARKKWYLKTPENRLRGRLWKLKNPERNRELARAQQKRYWTIPEKRILMTLRMRIRMALKHNSKYGTTKELLGLSIPEVKKYLESKFKSGMTWVNHGKWHLDHIRPLSAFDLAKPEEQQKAFHYTNLQPLWAIENLKKGTKIL